MVRSVIADGILYQINNNEATAYKLLEQKADVVIPSTVNCLGNNVIVNNLGGALFNQNNIIKSIQISNSVVELGDHCFYSCNRLTSITIPSSVIRLGNLCFAWCSGLSSITIPSSVTSIGLGCFAKCSELTSMYVEAKIPPKVSNLISDSSVLNTCTLYVPIDTSNVYKSTDTWKDFKIIKEFDFITTLDNNILT